MKTTQLPQRVLGFAFCISLLTLFSGCNSTTVHGITPVYPKSRGWDERLFTVQTATVNSLQPELKWKGESESAKYDLAIWDTIIITDDPEPQPDKIIYKKTALSGTSHKVEILLKPNHPYYWSVRETGSETWSTVTVHEMEPNGNSRNTHLFRFYTTKEMTESEKKLLFLDSIKE